MAELNLNLKGRTIVVTGAGQGIGRATSELVVALGGNVVAVDLNAAGLEELSDALSPERVQAVVGSVSDYELAGRSIAEAAERFGGVDGLVNNAGIVRAAMIEKMPPQQWQEVVDVNLTGAFYWLQATGRYLLNRVREGGAPGAIVNVTSDAGRKGAIGQINYAAAKAGMLGLTMSAALEWGKHGIRCNSVAFGIVETPMTEVVRGEKFRDTMLARIPLQRWAKTEEVVQAICFLLSDGASYITGQHLGVNGGFHMSA